MPDYDDQEDHNFAMALEAEEADRQHERDELAIADHLDDLEADDA